jgi:hypothetical protein
MKLTPSDDPTVDILDVPDDLQRKSSEDSSNRWSDGLSEDTIGLSDAQFESRQRRANTTSSAPDEQRLGLEIASVYLTVMKKPTETFWRQVLQHRMIRRTVGVEQLCQQIFSGYMTWRAPDELTPRKSIALVHPMLPFLVVVSQRLFEFLRLFIPPPLTNLRLQDCVEVQGSARHLDDHIQSIQVLNCSSLDMHMLSVCA